MNKSDLIHEIFLFDKEIADYGIQKEVSITGDYFLKNGVLHRKISNNETISSLMLIGPYQEKELLAFYEVFFSLIDSDGFSFKEGATYAEKVLNFIKERYIYDKFELVRDRSNNNEEYNSVEKHFELSYNFEFLWQNESYKDSLKKEDKLDLLKNIACCILFFSLIVSSVGVIIGVNTLVDESLRTIREQNIYITGISCVICLLSYCSIALYFARKLENLKENNREWKYTIGTFKDIDKKEFFGDIDKFYKDDLFYKELKKQYNITNIKSSNKITGD